MQSYGSTAKDFRAKARGALSGSWGTAILVCFVAGLLGGGGGGSAGGSASSGATRAVTDNPGIMNDFSAGMDSLYASPAGRMLTIAVFALAVAAILIALVCLFIGGAVEVGQKRYFTMLHRGENPTFSTLFSGMNKIGSAFVMAFLRNLAVGAGMILCIVPGIILSYMFAMASYIMADNPEIGPIEALRSSCALMKGHKLRLFCLHLSFIGWSILAAFTCAIGYLWLNPYMQAAEAAFYLEISGQQNPAFTYDSQETFG